MCFRSVRSAFHRYLDYYPAKWHNNRGFDFIVTNNFSWTERPHGGLAFSDTRCLDMGFLGEVTGTLNLVWSLPENVGYLQECLKFLSVQGPVICCKEFIAFRDAFLRIFSKNKSPCSASFFLFSGEYGLKCWEKDYQEGVIIDFIPFESL